MPNQFQHSKKFINDVLISKDEDDFKNKFIQLFQTYTGKDIKEKYEF